MSSDPVPDALVQQLQSAVADLSWTSETDAPFDVSLWPGLDASPSTEQVLQRAQLPPETPVEVLDLETFLAPVVRSPYDGESQAISEQFQALQSTLIQTLQSIQVYSCGEIELEIYIVGRALSGSWIAIHTAAVET
jgi:Nuclease A inhibitor-like protein